MIDTILITQKQLDRIKDHIIQFKKPWSVDATLMHDEHIILWHIVIEGKMDHTEAFILGTIIHGA
jgi:putative sterol carrier protein